MLDDLNKIVPKLDENDSDKIYNNIINRNTKIVKKKKNLLAFKIIMPIASFALFIGLIISIGILVGSRRYNGYGTVTGNTPTTTTTTTISTTPTTTTGDTPGGNNNYISISKNINEKDAIGIAAYREFDSKNTTKLTSSLIILDDDLTTTEETPTTETTTEDDNSSTTIYNESTSGYDENGYYYAYYPYDYVKIDEAYKFIINVDDINDEIAKEIIETNCGLGKLEVVVADFTTYEFEDDYVTPSISDTLVCIRGYNGYYTILMNSWTNLAYETGITVENSLSVFSSHKRIDETTVSKDFTPPVLTIYVEVYDDVRYLQFKSANKILSRKSYDRNEAFENIDTVETVTGDTLYSVLELTKAPEIEIEVTITNIDYEENIIYVNSSNNLSYVRIDESTKGLTIDELQIGDSIIVKYELLFDGYNPSGVIANSIEMDSNNVVEEDSNSSTEDNTTTTSETTPTENTNEETNSSTTTEVTE